MARTDDEILSKLQEKLNELIAMGILTISDHAEGGEKKHVNFSYEGLFYLLLLHTAFENSPNIIHNTHSAAKMLADVQKMCNVLN